MLRLTFLEKEKAKEKARIQEIQKELAKEEKVAGVTIARAILMTLSTAIAMAVLKDKEEV